MPIVSTIASDSKLHTRGRISSFRGCLGVCLLLDSPDSLNTVYEDFILGLFSKYKVERSRLVYKAADLREKLPLSNTTRFTNALEEFYTSLLDIKYLSIVIFYTTFNTKKLPNVTYYGRSRTPTKVVKTLDFLNELSNYYNYICAWKVQKVLSLKSCNIFLDSFEGEVTNSWNELKRNHVIKIYMRGDQCNPLIASADLVTRFVDEILALRRLKLDGNGIEELLEEYGNERVYLYYIGQSDLIDIVPALDEPIPIYKYLHQPSVFLLSEGIIKREKLWFEKSAVYDKVLNFASEIGGGFKRVDLEKDYTYIMHNSDSYLIYQGDKGHKEAEYIKKLYPIKIVGLDEIKPRAINNRNL
jgi:hypothetical protein